MPRAGYCAECGAYAWLREDGSCERGHPAASVSQEYDAAPVAEPVFERTANSARTLWALAASGIVVVLVLLVGVGVLGTKLLRPLASKGSAAASHWDERLAQDYPGWKKVGFNVNSYSGSEGSETEYTFALVPPGRAFPVGVTYRSIDGAVAVSEDTVLRSNGDFPERSQQLLDYIDVQYVRKGRDVVSVISDETGDVSVTWRKVSGFLFFHWSTGSYDDLAYDEDTQAWKVTFSPDH